MKRYLIASAIFVLYLILIIVLAFALHFEGTKFALFIILLALIGAAAVAATLWFLAKSSPAVSGNVNASEAASLDAVLRDANAKLRTAPQSGGKSLASLPLIYVLGDENSAKTQTILQSGLDPELLAGQLHRDGVLAPTQMANLWLAGGSVLVEAGGALLRQPALFSRLIRATQPGRLGSVFGKGAQPTRAVILCVSVERLLAPNTPDNIRALAQTLNERLRQLSQTLGISLPVYVLFTKLDTVPAFAPYTGHLSLEEVKLPLGSLLATLPAGAGLYAERASTQVAARFDELVYALAEFRLEILARGGDLPALARAYEFPRDLRKLRAGIVDFLVDLARPSQLGVNPFLRGFFFTGMRALLVDDNLAGAPAQPQQPIAPIDAGATRAFSLAAIQQQYQQPQPSRGARKVPQWVFLPHLFSRLLLTDKSALETSRSSSRVSLLKRALLASLCACIFLYLLLLTISFFNNRSLEARVTSAATASISRPQPSQLATVSDLQTLDQLGSVLRELDSYRKNGAPLMSRWGLWTGDTLYPLACHAYASKFRTLLLTPTQSNILTTLRALQSPPTPDADYNATYKPLKAYLITTSNPEKSTVEFLSPVLMSQWSANAQSALNASPDLARLAQAQFDLYAALLAQPASCLASAGGRPDLTTVFHTRDYLNGFSGFQHVYQSMLAAANHKAPPVIYNTKFPGSARYLVDTYPVPGAFTKPGFAFMQDAIQHPDPYFSGEEWVLGRTSNTTIDRTTLPAQLQKQYVADYLAAWRAYLAAAHFNGYTGMSDAANKLSALDSNVSPILELFSLISFHTGVALPDIANAFQPPQAVVPPTNPENRFTAPTNEPYIQSLQGLEQAIKQVSLNPLTANDPAAALPIIQAASAADQAAETLRNTFNPDPDGKMDSTSFAILEAPIKSASALAAHAPAAAAGGGAKAFCEQAGPVLAKFPFNPQSPVDASPEEVALVFSPGQGSLSALYNKSLSQLLTLQNGNYVPTPGSTIPISPAFLSFFNAAEKVSAALFPAGGTQPTLTFTLSEPKVTGAPNASLSIDGQQLNAGQTAAFHWVAQPSSRITLTSEQNSAPTITGPWSVFHLADTATHPTPNTLEYAFQFNGHTNQTVRFTVEGPAAPLLDPHFMSRLRCVATVAR